MATQQQLVRLAEVADTIGAPWVSVERWAGRDVWWTGEPAVNFATARTIAEEWAANQEAAREIQRLYEAEQESNIEREREQYRHKREAEQQQGGVIPGGIAVSYPPGEEAWTE